MDPIANESNIIAQADILFHLERYRDAEELLRRWLMTSLSSSASVQAVLSQAISLQPGRFIEARAEAQRAVALDPDNSAGYYALALLLIDGDQEGALQAIRQALRLAPNWANYHTLLARVYLELKQPQKALEAIEAARRLAPENVHCIQTHAVVLLRNRQPGKAREVLNAGLRLDPENATVHSTMGWTLLRLGESDLARLHFSEALRLEPNSAEARSGLTEALKSRYPFYKWIFRLFQLQLEHPRLMKSIYLSLAVIGGIIVSPMFVFPINPTKMSLAWVIVPLIILLLASVLIFPTLYVIFFNLLLRFDPYGQLALTQDQIWVTNWILAAFICLALAGVEYLSSQDGMSSLAVLIVSIAAASFIIGWPSRKTNR